MPDLPNSCSLPPSKHALKQIEIRAKIKLITKEFIETVVAAELQKTQPYPELNIACPEEAHLDYKYFVQCCKDILSPKGYLNIAEAKIGMTAQRSIYFSWEEHLKYV